MILLAMLLVGRASAEEPISRRGETRFSESLAGHEINVRIQTREVSVPLDKEEQLQKTFSCTFSRDPCSLTESLEISVDGKSIFVPRSAFETSSDFISGEIRKFKQNYILSLRGGDGSEAYVLEIEFDDRHVIQRVVRQPGGAKKILEKTIYF